MLFIPRNRLVRFYFVGMTAVLLAAFGWMGWSAGSRHHGFLLIQLVAATWLDNAVGKPGVSHALGPVRTWILRAALCGGVWSAAMAARVELDCDFSGARATAHRIENLNRYTLGRPLWATYGSGECEGILAFLPGSRAEFFSLELEKPYRYLVHDSTWKSVDPKGHMLGSREVTSRFLAALLDKGYKEGYLILPMQSMTVSVSTNVSLIPLPDETTGCVFMVDEKFVIHQLKVIPQR